MLQLFSPIDANGNFCNSNLDTKSKHSNEQVEHKATPYLYLPKFKYSKLDQKVLKKIPDMDKEKDFIFQDGVCVSDCEGTVRKRKEEGSSGTDEITIEYPTKKLDYGYCFPQELYDNEFKGGEDNSVEIYFLQELMPTEIS